MGVAAEALEEAGHLLVHHGVVDHALVEILLLRLGRQLAVEQQVAGFEKVAFFGELFDRIAAVFQDTGVAVDIGDLGLAAAGGGEAGIIGKHSGLGVELGDVDDVGPNAAAQNREIVGLVADRQRCVFAWFCVHREVPDEIVAKAGQILGHHSRWRSRPDGLKVPVKWVSYCRVHCKMARRTGNTTL